MPNAMFTAPGLDSLCQLDRLGLTATGQSIDADGSILECRVLEPDNWCHQCGQQGVCRGTVIGRLAHVPLGWRPTILQVRVRRYRCPDCRSVWRQHTSAAVEPRAVLSRHAALWALKGVVIDRLSVARVAAGLAVAWNTANDAILAAGQKLLINDSTRFDGVGVIGVDEHAWSHTRQGSKYVTVIIDLTPVRDGTGTSRCTNHGG